MNHADKMAVEAFGRFEKYIPDKKVTPAVPRKRKVLPAHIEDARDDHYLWKFLGRHHVERQKLAAYRRMMNRRNLEPRYDCVVLDEVV